MQGSGFLKTFQFRLNEHAKTPFRSIYFLEIKAKAFLRLIKTLRINSENLVSEEILKHSHHEFLKRSFY